MTYAGERWCDARNCPERATWIVRYDAFLHNHRKPTAYLCERHAKGRRDTRHAYVVEKRPMAAAPQR